MIAGWVISQLDGGQWCVRHTDPATPFIAGFETSHDAAYWLLAFFGQNADRAEQLAYRRECAQARERREHEAMCAVILGEKERGKVH
jgi:hypothetical protein